MVKTVARMAGGGDEAVPAGVFGAMAGLEKVLLGDQGWYPRRNGSSRSHSRQPSVGSLSSFAEEPAEMKVAREKAEREKQLARQRAAEAAAKAEAERAARAKRMF